MSFPITSHLMDHDFTSTTFDDEPFPQHETRATSANFACPACQSPRTIPRDTGKKAGAAIGTVAGAAGGISGALSGAVTGTEIGMAMAASATTSNAVSEGDAWSARSSPSDNSNLWTLRTFMFSS
ncbi:hypothetical protein [Variovorax sp. YR266]|uniref:hypothetical protein n=1 Tax=Variovorax sp. YR266 TaxID=1884386 RepID=UPI000AEF8E23|nr:hypothetical protein [Variovorax sp. YR266]